MMKKIILMLVLFVITKNEAPAQDKKEKKFFASQISTGIIEGEQGTSFHIETLNGVRYKTWFGGIGAGLDYYYIRSVPVYLSATKYLSPRNHSFYIQGDVGLNFAWENDQMATWNEVSSEFKPGVYWNGSVGFATGLDKKNSFTFGLGYSHKSLKEVKEIAIMCFSPPCENSFETYKYNLKRLTLRLGWQFNYSR